VQPTKLPDILARREAEILGDWLRHQSESRGGRVSLREPAEQSREFLDALRSAVQSGHLEQITGSDWAAVREILTGVSQAHARQGLTATETATFVLSLKQPLFSAIRR
jgi:rsbT co-antagonist protein RsbR